MSMTVAAIVFGWPGPILAAVLSVIGALRMKAGWFIAAAIVIAPFSFYLTLNPKTPWGFVLPVLLLSGAVAVSRRAQRLAWLAVLILVGVLVWLVGVVASVHLTLPRG